MYSKILVDIFGQDNLASGEQRLAITKQMATLATALNVTSAELDIVKLVFEEFHQDSLMGVRLEISKAVCRSNIASRHLILKIAEDCASVAQFVLHHSVELSSIDLIEHVAKGSPVKQLAIANRLNLENEVALAIIEHGSIEVVYALIGNMTANLSTHNLRQIYINFAADANLRELLCGRIDIPADLRELIAYDVAKSLEKFVTKANWLNPKQASNITQKSYEITVIEISDSIAESDMMDYIQRLSEEERLTSSLILRSITTGYMKFFEYSLAYLSGTPIQKLQSLLYNPMGSTRNALFNRSKLPRDLFPILTISIDVYKNMKREFSGNLQPGTHEFSVQMIKNVTEYYHAEQLDNQAYLQRILDCYYIDISDKLAA